MFCSSYFRILVHLYGLTFLAVFQRTLLKSTYAMSAKTSPLPDPPSLPPSSLPPTLPLLSIKISLELQLNHDGANKNAIFMKVPWSFKRAPGRTCDYYLGSVLGQQAPPTLL